MHQVRREPPTLDAYRDDDALYVWCTHCERYHAHTTMGPSFGDGDGLRVAHCTRVGTPHVSGYILKEVPGPRPKQKKS